MKKTTSGQGSSCALGPYRARDTKAGVAHEDRARRRETSAMWLAETVNEILAQARETSP
jgi:hypothetical protein